MPDRPTLRVVGDDERASTGSIETVIEDLEVAHGHIVEADAEARALPGNNAALTAALVVANDAVTRAIAIAHGVVGP